MIVNRKIDGSTILVNKASIRDNANKTLAMVSSKQEVVAWLAKHSGGPYTLSPEQIGGEITSKGTEDAQVIGPLGNGTGKHDPKAATETYTHSRRRVVLVGEEDED